MSEGGGAPAPARLDTRGNAAKALLFIALWLLPITWVGLTGVTIPFAGPWLSDLYRVSCLFTERVPSWPAYYLQVQAEDGRWTSLDREAFAPMEPFGYRSRIERYLAHGHPFPGMGETEAWRQTLADELAAWTRTRYVDLYPDEPPPRALRIVELRYPVGGALAAPEGRWRVPPFEESPEALREVVELYTWPAGAP